MLADIISLNSLQKYSRYMTNEASNNLIQILKTIHIIIDNITRLAVTARKSGPNRPDHESLTQWTKPTRWYIKAQKQVVEQQTSTIKLYL